jgi:hypothetical protein
MCNIVKYLCEQELICRRIARSWNDGTQAQAEWARTAQMLFERRREHLAVCRDCGCKSK